MRLALLATAGETNLLLVIEAGINEISRVRFNRKQRWLGTKGHLHGSLAICSGILRAHQYGEGFFMLGELRNLPTDVLLDIVFVILAGGLPLTLSEEDELERIQRELQRRGEREGARLCHKAIGL